MCITRQAACCLQWACCCSMVWALACSPFLLLSSASSVLAVVGRGNWVCLYIMSVLRLFLRGCFPTCSCCSWVVWWPGWAQLAGRRVPCPCVPRPWTQVRPFLTDVFLHHCASLSHQLLVLKNCPIGSSHCLHACVPVNFCCRTGQWGFAICCVCAAFKRRFWLNVLIMCGKTALLANDGQLSNNGGDRYGVKKSAGTIEGKRQLFDRNRAVCCAASVPRFLGRQVQIGRGA